MEHVALPVSKSTSHRAEREGIPNKWSFQVIFHALYSCLRAGKSHLKSQHLLFLKRIFHLPFEPKKIKFQKFSYITASDKVSFLFDIISSNKSQGSSTIKIELYPRKDISKMPQKSLLTFTVNKSRVILYDFSPGKMHFDLTIIYFFVDL